LRESRIMLVQYVTAAAAIVLVTIHLLMQGVLVPYSLAIDFPHVLSVYRTWVDAALLESLLVVVVVHGFNGLRTILHEWRQGVAWSRWVDRGTIAVIVVVVAYGTRTLILAATGTVVL